MIYLYVGLSHQLKTEGLDFFLLAFFPFFYLEFPQNLKGYADFTQSKTAIILFGIFFRKNMMFKYATDSSSKHDKVTIPGMLPTDIENIHVNPPAQARFSQPPKKQYLSLNYFKNPETEQ